MHYLMTYYNPFFMVYNCLHLNFKRFFTRGRGMTTQKYENRPKGNVGIRISSQGDCQGTFGSWIRIHGT